MDPIKRDQIESALSSKGFELRQGDHRFYYFYANGKKTRIRTKISMGTKHKEYGASLLKAMSNQLKLTNKQLKDLLNCPMSEEEYLAIVADKI